MLAIIDMKIRNEHFWSLSNEDGLLTESPFTTGQTLTRFYGFGQKGCASLELPDSEGGRGVTHYVFVQSGTVTLTGQGRSGNPFPTLLQETMSASCPGPISVAGS